MELGLEPRSLWLQSPALDMAHLLYLSPPEPRVSTGAVGSGLTCRQQSLRLREIWKVSRVMGSDLARRIAITNVNMKWTGRGRNRPKREDRQRLSEAGATGLSDHPGVR